MPSRRPPLFVFVHSRFPCLSETFVHAQAQSLAAMGMPIVHVSNHRPLSTEVHERMRAITDEVFYLQDVGVGELRRALRWAERSLSPYVRTAWRDFWRRAEPLSVRMRQWLGALVLLHRFAGHPIHVHAHFTYGGAAVARACRQLAGVPYSLTLHGADVTFDDPPDLAAKIHDAAALVSISQHNFDFLIERWGESLLPAPRAVIPLGVVPQPYRDPPVLEQPLRVLSVGRLSEHKAQHVLVEACARLRDRGIAVRCDIVGAGEREALLRAQIASMGLQSSVCLLGPRDHDEVLRLYRQYHLFVLTSVVEGMPTVLMEAMNASVPIVTTNVGAVIELVGDAALLVPPNDSAAVAQAMAQVACGAIDVGALTRRAHARLCERFDAPRNHAQFAQFLRALPVAVPGEYHPGGT